jgi:Lrp/AsnC family transcriptional regulator for asnA, asnC and gidA
MAVELDETDERILSALEKDAKARIHVIAKKLGIPASTVHHRIKRLEREGAIERYTIRKGFRQLGYGIKAHVLVFVDVTELKKMKKTQHDIAHELAKIAGVESVEIITGEADLLLTVRCPDMDGYKNILLGRIQAIEGITETRTMMVIGE